MFKHIITENYLLVLTFAVLDPVLTSSAGHVLVLDSGDVSFISCLHFGEERYCEKIVKPNDENKLLPSITCGIHIQPNPFSGNWPNLCLNCRGLRDMGLWFFCLLEEFGSDKSWVFVLHGLQINFPWHATLSLQNRKVSYIFLFSSLLAAWQVVINLSGNGKSSFGCFL